MTEDIKKTSKDNDAFLSEMRKRYRASADAVVHNHEAAADDLEFLNGNQWPESVKADRERDGRPMLTVNRGPAFLDQVIGDQRQNKPAIKVRPVDSGSDPEIAKIYEGMIRNIEYQSDGEYIYDSCLEQTAGSGFSYFRLLTQYADPESFDQEIRLRHIPNQFSVYFDPDAVLPNKEDARYAFIVEEMDEDEFKRRYPGKDVKSFSQDNSYDGWYGEEKYRVAEYFVKKPRKKTIALLSTGAVMDKAEAEKLVETMPEVSIVKTRETEEIEVYQYHVAGDDTLDGPKKWDGRYIPIIEVCGKELNIKGKRYLRSLIRHAKDPLRMYNYWVTTIAENLTLVPKAPYIVTGEQIEGYENEWATANTKNAPYLRYNWTEAGKPQREAPATLPTGAFNQAQMAVDDIKATMGMFDASIGNQSNETSGKAIMARQREGDVANFAFVDNLRRAIAYAGKQIVDLIPKIYDTEKVVRIVGADKTESFMPVNMSAGKVVEMVRQNPGRFKGIDPNRIMRQMAPDRPTIFNDLTVGKYDVVVETGPSFTTQRVEAAEEMAQIIQATPQLMEVMGDLYFKNRDFPGADEIAERLKKTLPPGLAEPEEGKEPEPPQPPPPPTPAEQLEAQKIELEFAKLEVEKAKIANEGEDLDTKIRHTVIEVMREVHAP